MECGVLLFRIPKSEIRNPQSAFDRFTLNQATSRG